MITMRPSVSTAGIVLAHSAQSTHVQTDSNGQEQSNRSPGIKVRLFSRCGSTRPVEKDVFISGVDFPARWSFIDRPGTATRRRSATKTTTCHSAANAPRLRQDKKKGHFVAPSQLNCHWQDGLQDLGMYVSWRYPRWLHVEMSQARSCCSQGFGWRSGSTGRW